MPDMPVIAHPDRTNPALAVLDGLSCDTRFLDVQSRWKTIAYNNLMELRTTLGLKVRIVTAPRTTGEVIPAKKINLSQIVLKENSWVYGFRFVNAAGPTLALARNFSLRIRETNKSGITGSNFINAGAFAPGTTSQSNMYIPCVPWWVSSGLITVEIANNTATDATGQLAMFVLEPQTLPSVKGGSVNRITYPDPKYSR